MKKRRFNMIEILIAMTIIVIGFSAVVALLPLGLSTNRQAQEKVYTTLAVDNLINYLKGEVGLHRLTKRSGNTDVTNTLYIYTCENALALGYDGNKKYESGPDYGAGGTKMQLPARFKTKEEGNFSEEVLPDKYTRVIPTTFKMYRSKKELKAFYMEFGTEINNELNIEFDCIATIAFYSGTHVARSTNGITLQGSKSFSSYVGRIEWPASVSVDKRKVKEFYGFLN